MMRGTGGNRFVPGDASIEDVIEVIRSGLYDVKYWADETGGTFDLGKISVDTTRIASGKISVEVSGDLYEHSE